MRSAFALVFALAICATGFAQQWEAGAAGGAGFLTGASVSGPAGAATAGFKPGAAAGGFLANNLYSSLSGELRYTWAKSNLKLSSGGTEAVFGAMSHVIHYDLLFHAKPRASGLRPFVAVGGGMKVYQGTGAEAAFQPLNQFGYLTKTHQVEPLISAGAGVKYPLRPNMLLRVEFRDYITPFPKEVIAPAPGATISGWVQNIVPLVGISYTF